MPLLYLYIYSVQFQTSYNTLEKKKETLVIAEEETTL